MTANIRRTQLVNIKACKIKESTVINNYLTTLCIYAILSNWINYRIISLNINYTWKKN